MSDNKESDRRDIPGREVSSQNHVPPSPPAFVSLEELMKAARDVANMRIAHEIALNSDFKIEKPQVSTNSVEAVVRLTMEKAFWDLLSEELSQDPPCFVQALRLMAELKQGLLDLLLPQHTGIKQRILDILDDHLILQQAQQGTIQFHEYGNFVISVMRRMCAPVRDEQIEKLKLISDIVPLFRGIMETLELMKMDMANFAIEYLRPHLTSEAAIAYEREKFAKFLAIQGDELVKTREWLGRHFNAGEELTDLKRRVTCILNDAYLDLIDWKESSFPETLSMDEDRVKNFTKYSHRITRVASMFLVTLSHSGQQLGSDQEWKLELKKRILIVADEELSSMSTTIAAFVQESARARNMSVPLANDLSAVLAQIETPDHPVTNLLRKRLREFLLQTISSKSAEKMRVPPGLSILQPEMAQLAGSFLRLVTHNRSVFADYYFDIVKKHLQL